MQPTQKWFLGSYLQLLPKSIVAVRRCKEWSAKACIFFPQCIAGKWDSRAYSFPRITLMQMRVDISAPKMPLQML